MSSTFFIRVFDVPVRVRLTRGFTDEDVKDIRRSWSRCLTEETFDPSELEGLDLDAAAVETEGGLKTPYGFDLLVMEPGAELRVLAAKSRYEAAEIIVSHVTLEAIHARVGQNIMLHAAGLSDSRGRAIALVAASGTGKTTACRRLGKSLNYLTDETVFLDGMTVRPYPKPLSVIEEEDAPKVQHSPDTMGLGPTPKSATLVALAVLNRVPEGTLDPSDDYVISPLTSPEMLHAIVPQSSGVPRLERPFEQLLTLYKEVGGAVKITYSDSERILPAVRELLNDFPQKSTTPRVEYLDVLTPEEAESTPPADAEDPSAVRYLQAPAKDAACIDDRLMVILDDVMVEVSDLGQTIWLALESWRTLDEIVDEVESFHGEHPEAAAIVEQALEQMDAQGLIVTHRP